MEMRISLLQFEHLIDGRKPEARDGLAMFAPHVFARLGMASRNATVLLVHKHAVFVRMIPTCLLFTDMTNTFDVYVIIRQLFVKVDYRGGLDCRRQGQ